MSFFGFDTSGRGHDTSAPGFSKPHDPFAGLSGQQADDALEFDDTYDGLGDQLEETNDDFNDDTFGGDAVPTSNAFSQAKVGKDFDFFGQTAQVASAIEEEQLRYARQQPPARIQPQPQQQYYQQQPAQPVQPAYHRPARTGYEKYKEPEQMPDLNVDRSIWGMAPAAKPSPQVAHAHQAYHSPAQPAAQPVSRKIMSLEEVEASMRQPAKPAAQSMPPIQDPAISYAGVPAGYQAQHQPQHQLQPQLPQGHHGHGHPVTILQRPQSIQQKPTPPSQEMPAPPAQQHHQQTPPAQPTQILQNPNRASVDGPRAGPGHQPQGSMPKFPPQLAAHPQFQQMSETEKAAFLDQETKRAKRNHKIWLLSKDNGIMTPQDKNFITRIQLQQLVSATGNTGEPNNDASMTEDFYYHVYSHIRAGQRQNPSQPLSNFAQTYLYQTGSRHGGMRRHGRPAENHFQRMEQQVQRAVEAAKNKPKNPQLVIAGSLGKISFSNAKTPKPLLNIKRTESDTPKPVAKKENTTTLSRRQILRNVEQVYNTLMKIEDHIRAIPPPLNESSPKELHQKHTEWKSILEPLSAKLWDELQVHHPVDVVVPHPFIAFLSCAKGKKAMPRIFNHLNFEQRTTILTLIIYHLDQLDVVQGAVINSDLPLAASMRENIALFQHTVMPCLMQYLNDTDLDIVEAVLNLVAMKLRVETIVKTQVGVSMLTTIISRAELLKTSGAGSEEQWAKW